MTNRLTDTLLKPVDIISLVFFRIAFGAIMVWEVWRYFHHNRISRYYIDAPFTFTFYGFDWVQPWPGDLMNWHFIGLAVLATCIAAGFAYRLSTTLFFLGFTYVFLLDEAQYLNHFYLTSLISFILIFIPAHRYFSVDALLRPGIRSETAPAWALYWLRAQIAIPYFYGGLAKLNADWLRGEPLREWLGYNTDFPLIGPLFNEMWMIYLFSYGGLLLDLLVVPALFWRRTRIPALILAITFHLLNARLFNIGIFPWFMIAATLVLLPPSWLRVWERDWTPAPTAPARARFQTPLFSFIGVYLILQLAVPLRHFAYPGDPSWTEQGHPHAWHMRLRDKNSHTRFFASTDTTTWEIDPLNTLTGRQFRAMSSRPHMTLLYAHHLHDLLVEQGYENVEIRAWALSSLNSRSHQLLIDPTIDLASVPRGFQTASWILPLVQPFGGEPYHAMLFAEYENDLLLINAANIPLPLRDIHIVGDDISITAWPAGMLGTQGCVGLSADGDFPDTRGACTLVGSATATPPVVPFDVVFRGEVIAHCESLPCVAGMPNMFIVPAE